MTKKQLKEKNSRQRVMVKMNTGERVYKSEKDYDRQRSKRETVKQLTEY